MLFVLAYPELAPEAASAIEALRRRHEPDRAALVAVHVTLVFGVAGIQVDALVAHAAAIAATERPFPFTLDSTEPFIGAGEAKLFLRVGQGDDSFRRLHAGLYTGILAPHLRSDLPFEPHMTIATVRQPVTLDSAQTDAGRLDLPLAGRVRALTVAALDGPVLRDLEQLSLAG
ncbi:2'-5' RNA ligase family protein [Marinibaculum pumilum]|uniref:2'-5' RNA ligase family protein n=1 Tax=Marinibaculum pumilum TaxID=1766165 RepID=A0ABV7KXL1_9PROT